MHLLIRNISLIPISQEIDISKITYKLLDSDDEERLQRWSSLIGIITAIVGNILISFALNLQRFAHIKLHEDKEVKKLKERSLNRLMSTRSMVDAPNIDQGGDGDSPFDQRLQSRNLTSSRLSEQNHSKDKTYLHSPYWWVGIFLMTLGEAGNFLAYGFAPASIVSPLGVVALISNCVIAPILLKEKFRMRDFWGVTVSIAGAVTVVLSANQQEQKLGPHEIWEAIIRTEFEIYMAITLGLIGILAWASPKFGSKTILIDLGLVGLLGGYTALSTKGISSMISSTLWRALKSPITYGLVLVLVSTAVMQVRYVNKALQRFDSTQVIPVQFVTFTLSVIVGSAILYRDLEKITIESAIKFMGGCLLTFLGVWLITSGRPPNDKDDFKRVIINERALEEQIDLLDVDDNSGNLTETFQNVDTVDRSHSTMNTRRSSLDSLVDRSQKSKRTFNSSYLFSKLLSKFGRTTYTSGDFSEESPLLNQSENFSSEQTPRNIYLESQDYTISPLETQIQRSYNYSMPPAPSTLSSPVRLPTITNLQQSPVPLQAGKILRPVTPPTCHPLSRLITGPLISPLTGELSGATADSFRRVANSSTRSRAQSIFRHGLHRSISESTNLETGHNNGLCLTKENDELSNKLSASLECDHRQSPTKVSSSKNNLQELIRGASQKSDKEVIEVAGPSGL